MSRSADTAVPRFAASAFQFSNATSYGRRSSVKPSSCVAQHDAALLVHPAGEAAVRCRLVRVDASRHARMVSGRAPIHRRPLRVEHTAVVHDEHALRLHADAHVASASSTRGSNIGSVYVAPTFGRSPSATASGTSVGSRTGPTAGRAACPPAAGDAAHGEQRAACRRSPAPTP